MKHCFKAWMMAAALSIAAQTTGCRVQRELQAHTVAGSDSIAVGCWEESEELHAREWKNGFVERVEVEFFPPEADSIQAEKQSTPALKRITRTTVRTQDSREEDTFRERAGSESVQVQTVHESTLVRKRQTRPAFWPWVLLAASIAGCVLIARKRLRLW